MTTASSTINYDDVAVTLEFAWLDDGIRCVGMKFDTLDRPLPFDLLKKLSIEAVLDTMVHEDEALGGKLLDLAKEALREQGN